ncbi:hypothetical protein C4Q27_01130 [Pseudomonas sp. SWI36]|uniref:hypothetical protein n=1 Tax=Pseudomonas sp. SWI36 TaxID=2083052 RepID=UPI000CE5E3D8|nr:hypothetical protein [Pseudomonas sp. SWI36]AVD91135.1 hypothetical protein C4Q27_01130 [Pseudomonas sp. SWI36]
MLEANINQHLSTLTASQLAKLLVMRKGLQFGYDYTFTDDDGQSTDVDLAFLAAAPGELLEVLFEENEHDDAINEVRYEAEQVSGIPEWCHYSWGRNYEVDVKAFILPDGRALAFCEMSGGGKHGDPNAYPWVNEAKFIKVAGVEERVIKTYKFEEIPEAAGVEP